LLDDDLGGQFGCGEQRGPDGVLVELGQDGVLVGLGQDGDAASAGGVGGLDHDALVTVGAGHVAAHDSSADGGDVVGGSDVVGLAGGGGDGALAELVLDPPLVVRGDP